MADVGVHLGNLYENSNYTQDSHIVLILIQKQTQWCSTYQIEYYSIVDLIFDLGNAKLVCKLALSSNPREWEHFESTMHNASDLEVKLKSKHL